MPATEMDEGLFSPSPELLEYRRRKAAWNDCFPERDYEEDEAWEARTVETSDAVEEAIEIFLERAKAPRSWHDVQEIAEVQFTELFELEDGKLHKHSDHEDMDTMLLRAVLAMAGNPIEAMPSKPEPDVPAGSVIKLPNRPYAAERPSYWMDYDIVFAGTSSAAFLAPSAGPNRPPHISTCLRPSSWAGYGQITSRPPGIRRSLLSSRKRVRRLRLIS
jgi:hypothetical protein